MGPRKRKGLCTCEGSLSSYHSPQSIPAGPLHALSQSINALGHAFVGGKSTGMEQAMEGQRVVAMGKRQIDPSIFSSHHGVSHPPRGCVWSRTKCIFCVFTAGAAGLPALLLWMCGPARGWVEEIRLALKVAVIWGNTENGIAPLTPVVCCRLRSGSVLCPGGAQESLQASGCQNVHPCSPFSLIEE